MTTRSAKCSCGELTADCTGAPARVSVCHCLACQRRTGSAFGYNVTFAAAQVEVTGTFSTFTRQSDEGFWARFNFCPSCGATVFYEIERRPGMITIPGGAFADPDLWAPNISIYENRRHGWCTIEGEDVERDTVPIDYQAASPSN